MAGLSIGSRSWITRSREKNDGKRKERGWRVDIESRESDSLPFVRKFGDSYRHPRADLFTTAINFIDVYARYAKQIKCRRDTRSSLPFVSMCAAIRVNGVVNPDNATRKRLRKLDCYRKLEKRVNCPCVNSIGELKLFKTKVQKRNIKIGSFFYLNNFLFLLIVEAWDYLIYCNLRHMYIKLR